MPRHCYINYCIVSYHFTHAHSLSPVKWIDFMTPHFREYLVEILLHVYLVIVSWNFCLSAWESTTETQLFQWFSVLDVRNGSHFLACRNFKLHHFFIFVLNLTSKSLTLCRRSCGTSDNTWLCYCISRENVCELILCKQPYFPEWHKITLKFQKG